MKIKSAIFLTSVLLLVLLLSPGNAFGVPEKVEKTFREKYGTSIKPTWEIDSHGYWEAKFLSQGKKFRADFSARGKWIETERNIKFKELPKAVREAIRAEFGHRKIEEIEEVDSAAKGRFFDVEFARKGKNEDVEYDAAGRKIPAGTDG